MKNLLQPRFLVIVTGYNSGELAANCIKSLYNQTYQNFTAVLISDGSTDSVTENTIKFYFKYRTTNTGYCKFIPIVYYSNFGAAKRRFDAITYFCPEDEAIVVLLGLDDELLPNALEIIAEKYENENCWMTYGNWYNGKGKSFNKEALYFDEETHANRDYRKVTYRSTAPNTFKAFLFNQLTKEDFKINGVWIDSTTESPLMFACLEMCGKEKIGVIEEHIYLYNDNLPNGTLARLGSPYKYRILDVIRSREKKPLLIRK